MTHDGGNGGGGGGGGSGGGGSGVGVSECGRCSLDAKSGKDDVRTVFFLPFFPSCWVVLISGG